MVNITLNYSRVVAYALGEGRRNSLKNEQTCKGPDGCFLHSECTLEKNSLKLSVK